MQTLRTTLLALVLALVAPLTAAAQCTGPLQDGTGPAITAPDGTMLYRFDYDDGLIENAQAVEFALHRRVNGAIAAAATSQQVFTRMAVARLSPGCYSVTLNEVPTLERGYELAARARAVLTDGRISAFSNYADPFVWPLPAPVLRRGNGS